MEAMLHVMFAIGSGDREAENFHYDYGIYFTGLKTDQDPKETY